MKKKLLALCLAASMVVMSLAGCGNGATQESAASGSAAEEVNETAEVSEAASEETSVEVTQSDIDKLTFTYVTAPLNVPTIVDKNEQFFVDELGSLGVDVEYVEITSGADQTQALASGDVQVLYAVGATSVILSAANGADIKVLNMYSRSPEAFCIYSTDDSLTSPESLRGKTIAGPAGTNLHELLVAYLATGGLTIDDVNYVNMGIPDAKAGLEGGSVDVALLAGAAAYQADQSGYHLITNGDGLISALIMVAVTEEFYNENPELIAAIQTAQENIASFMNENEDSAVEMVATELDMDEEAVRTMKAYYDFSLETSDEDIAGFQKTADFMYEAEMIETEVDVNTLFLQ